MQSGGCSLRAALQEANADPQADTIALPSGYYELILNEGLDEEQAASGDLDIRAPVRIVAVGGRATIADRDVAVHSPEGERIFDIDSGNSQIPVHLENLLIQFGKSHDQLGGGGILVRAGSSLELTGSVLYANGADRRGSGLAVYGTAEVRSSVLFDNHRAWNLEPGQGGGAIYVAPGGHLRLVESSIRGNSHCDGGGVFAEGPSVIEVLRSSFQGNRAQPTNECPQGKALGDQFAVTGPVQLTLTDSTLTHASVALRASAGAQVLWRHVTLAAEAGAHVGDLILEDAATRLTLANSILGRSNAAAAVCSAPPGSTESLGGNLYAFEVPCSLPAHESDLVVGALGLVPYFLAGDRIFVNDGEAPRRLLVPVVGSPAVDHGLNTHCTESDQAGGPRPVAGSAGLPARCDAGAVEWPLHRIHRSGFEARLGY